MASVTGERDCRCEFELLSTYNTNRILDPIQSKKEVYNLSCAQAAIFLGDLSKHSQVSFVESLFHHCHLVTKLTLTDGANTYTSENDSPDLAIKKIGLFVESPSLVPTLVYSAVDQSKTNNQASIGIDFGSVIFASLISGAFLAFVNARK